MLIDFIASALLIPFCFINSLPEKSNKKIIISMYLTSLAIYLIGYKLSYIDSFFLYVTYISIPICLLLIIFFTKNRILNLLSAIMGYIVSIVLNNIILFALDILFNIAVSDILGNLTSLIPFYIIYFTLLFVVTRILSYFIRKLDLSFLNKHKLSYLIAGELLICISILVFNIAYGKTINYPSETIYFNCILFILYFILSTALISKTIKTAKQAIVTEEKEKQYKELESYVRVIDENNQQLRKFKHDYLNILFTLDLLIKEKKTEELEKYFSENILTTKTELEKSNERLAPLSHIIDMPIRSLLISKFNLAISKQIETDISIFDNIHIPVLKPIETARILGILLDNAIESAMDVNNPEISFCCSDNLKNCEIIIANSLNTSLNFTVDGIMEKGFSTKGSGRGLGLNTVKEIINQYDNIFTDISISENIFTFSITIEK